MMSLFLAKQFEFLLKELYIDSSYYLWKAINSSETISM